MTDPSVNVTTVDDIPFDKLLGPVPVISNIMDTMVMIGLRCSEIRPVTQQLKIDPKDMENLTSSRYFHWLFYIQSARDEVEQNLEVITKHSQLYYRVIRNVSAGEELFVWYSKESAQIYKVPDVEEFYDKDDRKYACPYCSEAFLFPNPLKAHLMYRCEMRLAEVHGLSSVNRLQLDSINRLQLDLYSSAAAMLPSVKSAVSLKGLSITSLANSFLDIYRRTTNATAATATTSLKENDGGCADNDCDNHQRHQYVPRCAYINRDQISIKRKIDHLHPISEHGPIKRSRTNNNNNNNDHLMSGKSSKNHVFKSEFSRSTSSSISSLKKSISLNADLETSGSAFKKVINKGCRDRLSPSSSVNSSDSNAMAVYNRCDQAQLGHHQQTLNAKSLYPISYSLPLSAGSPPAAIALATSVGSWSIPQQQTSFHVASSARLMDIGTASSSSSIYANASAGLKRSTPSVVSSPTSMGDHVEGTPADSIYRLSVSLPSTYGGGAGASKQFATTTTSLMDNYMLTSKPLPPPLPPPPAPPSIAASLLPPSLAALAFPAQNWCAKCNASFRMTSDLVYHMRSHHKREVDPMKKKREEKLKCSICSESFRERHHLTRHMTSHQ